MSRDLQLAIRINGERAAADMRRFTNSASANLRHLSRETKQLWKDFNGFSTATKLFAAAGGLSAIRATLNTNLNFERDLLEMKQNAAMTITQVAELRKLALETARDALQMPDAIVQGEKAYARAGMKFEQIRDSIAEAARSATVMRSTVEQIANMDFDLQDKFHIPAQGMKAAHNMAYYHGNEGRFETPAMTSLAPGYLNALKTVGVGGMSGWNFAGAVTQSLMKTRKVTEPTGVVTLMEQGLGHLAAYAKDLKKSGIDVKKFGPKGQFGVEGLLKLAEAMKAKGLDDIYKLDKAGIKDQEAKTFWLQLMSDSAEIRKQMTAADKASKEDLMSVHLDEIKTANFGKIMAAEIQVQKLSLSDAAGQGTTVVGKAAEYAANNPEKVIKDAAIGTGLYLFNRYNNNRNTRLAGEANTVANQGITGGAQPVLVTNWPASQLSMAERMNGPAGRTPAGGTPQPASGDSAPARQSRMGGVAKGMGLFALASGTIVEAYDFGTFIAELGKGTWLESATDTIAKPIAQVLEKFMSQKIDAGGTINLKVDGPAKVTSLSTNDPKMNYNVDAGLTMPGAR